MVIVAYLLHLSHAFSTPVGSASLTNEDRVTDTSCTADYLHLLWMTGYIHDHMTHATYSCLYIHLQNYMHPQNAWSLISALAHIQMRIDLSYIIIHVHPKVFFYFKENGVVYYLKAENFSRYCVYPCVCMSQEAFALATGVHTSR